MGGLALHCWPGWWGWKRAEGLSRFALEEDLALRRWDGDWKHRAGNHGVRITNLLCKALSCGTSSLCDRMQPDPMVGCRCVLLQDCAAGHHPPVPKSL